MKISPPNQTLLLASERRVQGDQKPAGTLGRAIDAASSGGVLRRLTIVAARPGDELVYVQADYATAADGAAVQPPASAQAGSSLAVTQASTRQPADVHGNTVALSRDTGLSAYLPPAEQYARTQRNWSAAPRTGLDVHA